MATEATLVKGTGWSNSPVVCLARIRGPSGSYLWSTDLSEVTWSVYDLDNDKAVAGSGTYASPGSVVFTELQTGAIWTIDDTGYNFKCTVAAANFPTAEHRYRIVFGFVTLTSGTFYQPFEYYVSDATG